MVEEKEKLSIREYLAFGILLFVGYSTISSILFTLSSNSIYSVLIESSLDMVRSNPEVFERELSHLEEYWAMIGFRGQFFALILAISAFLIGIMVMRWINRMGTWEALKNVLGCIVFFVIIILIGNFISDLI